MGRKIGITSDQIEEMRFMEDEMKMPREAIAKEMGVSANVVRYYLGAKYVSHAPKHLNEEDVSKMLRLREKGLSNSKIAIEMGITKTTVKRHIGIQPTGTRAEYGSIISHVTGESFVKEKEARKLQRISTCVTFAGKDWTYEATDKGSVKITTSIGSALAFSVDSLKNLIGELQEVYDWMTKNDATPIILLDGKPKSQEKQLPL